ncbi:hypothetical protein [Frankia sp. Cas4]|nr:hypothetical protein [Frankia sp. Cas4]
MASTTYAPGPVTRILFTGGIKVAGTHRPLPDIACIVSISPAASATPRP